MAQEIQIKIKLVSIGSRLRFQANFFIDWVRFWLFLATETPPPKKKIKVKISAYYLKISDLWENNSKLRK